MDDAVGSTVFALSLSILAVGAVRDRMLDQHGPILVVLLESQVMFMTIL